MTEQLTAEDLERIKQIEAADARFGAKQGKRLVVNIDAAWAERSAQAFVFQFHGKEYSVPASMPARVFLFMWKHLFTSLGDGRFRFDIPDERFIETVEMVLGEELARDVLDSELSIGWVTAELVLPVLRAWGVPLGQDSGEQSTGEKKTPSTPESSSGPGQS